MSGKERQQRLRGQAANEGEMVIQTAALPSLASPCLTQGMANDGRNGVEDWIFLDIELTEVCHLRLLSR